MRLSLTARAMLWFVAHTACVVMAISAVWAVAAFDREVLNTAIGMTVAGLLLVPLFAIVAVRAVLKEREPKDKAALR